MTAIAVSGTAEVDQAERRGVFVRHAGTILLLAAVGFIFVFPILWAALSSLKSTDDIITGTYPLSWSSFLPFRPTVENYFYLFTELNLQRNLLNTLIAASGQVGIAVVASSLAGYAFARLRFPGNNLLFALLLLTDRQRNAISQRAFESGKFGNDVVCSADEGLNFVAAILRTNTFACNTRINVRDRHSDAWNDCPAFVADQAKDRTSGTLRRHWL